MYKVIVCDDNENIADGISRMTPWEELGIEFCGCGYDGLEGRALVDEFRPDILITDIQMPFLTGLELGRYAKKMNPNICIIIISGYDDFQYAKDAIKTGAMDYLMKPVNQSELLSLLQRAVEECRQNEARKELISEQAQRKLHDCLKNMMYRSLQKEKLAEEEEIELQLQRNSCVVAAICIDNFEQINSYMSQEEQQKINRRFLQCMEKYMHHYEIVEQRFGTVVGYFLAPDPQQVLQILKDELRYLRDAFSKMCPDMTLTAAISNIRPNCLRIHKSYTEALLALQEQYVYPAGSDIIYKKIQEKKEDPNSDETFENLLVISELEDLIRKGNRDAVRKAIEQLKEKLLKIGGKSYIFMKLYTGRIFSMLSSNLGQFGIEESDLDRNVVELFRNITESQSLNEALEQLYEYMVSVMDAIEKNSMSNNAKTVVEAQRYIEEHYSDSQLTLEDVAKNIHMSPSYFSVIFKREMNVSFTDYLIRLRIKKSQELMEHTNYKIYEIATKVGYDTAAYYSTAFKKETGMAPSDYRRALDEKKK